MLEMYGGSSCVAGNLDIFLGHCSSQRRIRADGRLLQFVVQVSTLTLFCRYRTRSRFFVILLLAGLTDILNHSVQFLSLFKRHVILFPRSRKDVECHAT